jgi:hypothetical protein
MEEKGEASLVGAQWRVSTAPWEKMVGMGRDETTILTMNIPSTDYLPLAGHRTSPTRRDALCCVSHLAEAQAAHGRLQLLEPPGQG